MTETQLPRTVSDVVAGRIQETRKRRNMNTKELAQACAKVDFPQLTASVIANIESGRRDKEGRRRRAVTVDEAYAFAEALGVGVTMLLPPPRGRSEDQWQLFDGLHEVVIDARRRLIESEKEMQEGLRQAVRDFDLDAEHEGMLREVLERYSKQPEGGDTEQLQRELLEVVMHQREVRMAAR
jgi:transcriptional regulator with XRE-family HTH domain